MNAVPFHGQGLPPRFKSPEPQRLPLDIERTMRTRYKINSLQELFDKTAPDFTPIYQRLQGPPDIAAGARQDQEEAIQR